MDDVFVKPGFLMINTPLLGFDENEEEFDGETIENALYQYFLDHPGHEQVIVVDNSNVIPKNTDVKTKGANVVIYHRTRKADTYTGLRRVGEKISRRNQYEIIL